MLISLIQGTNAELSNSTALALYILALLLWVIAAVGGLLDAAFMHRSSKQALKLARESEESDERDKIVAEERYHISVVMLSGFALAVLTLIGAVVQAFLYMPATPRADVTIFAAVLRFIIVGMLGCFWAAKRFNRRMYRRLWDWRVKEIAEDAPHGE